MKARGVERQQGVGDREPGAVVLEAAAGPEPDLRSGAPPIALRDQAIGQVGSYALGKVGKTHPHRTGPAS